MKYKDLVKDQIEHFTQLEDAKTAAVLIGALHMLTTLEQISDSRLTKWHPATANVCLCDVDEIAKNLTKGNEDDKTEVEPEAAI
jgi:hypothetical protein